MTKWIERIAIAVFCLLIAVPFGMSLLGIQSVSSENRTLAEAPSIVEAGTEFPGEFEAYYNDTFPLRAQLVRLNSWLSLNLLGTAPGNQVIAGEDGFLFFAETVPDYCNTREVSDEYLQELAAQLKAVQDAFAEQGTAFVLAVAPNKNSVYPEHMPFTYEKGDDSAYDRLMEFLWDEGVYAPDLKAALTLAKAEGLVYHKLDTHWNDRGAHAAYQAIAKEAMQQNESLQLPLYEDLVFSEQTFIGDLASTMMGLSGKETAPAHGLKAFYADSNDYYAPKLTTEYTESAHIMVYRDSFGTALVPYVAQASQRAFFTRALPYDFNAAQGADVVILEIAERNIETMLEELSIPTLQPTQQEQTGEKPLLPEEDEETAPTVLGKEIPTPEPFDKEALPENLSDVPSRSDEWDDYDPFSEPPGAIVADPSEEDEPEDVANYRLLVVTDKESAVVSVIDGEVLGGTLTVRGMEDGQTQEVSLLNGQFRLFQLKAGQQYAARAVIDGEEINFLMQAQPGDTAAANLQANFLPSGMELTWDGREDGVYRVYRSTFLESGWELVAEETGNRTLLPYADTLQSNYKIVHFHGGVEYGWSAPLTVMTPILDLPSSDREFDQQYLPLASREDQIIYIMARDIDGEFSIPVHAMLTSSGESESRTPTGAYEFWRKREWMKWTEGQYSQYNLDFGEKLKVHSVLFAEENHDTPIFNMRSYLGRAVSGGCLRLTVTDAKWLFERFGVGDYIEIVDGTRHSTLRQELKDTLPAL